MAISSNNNFSGKTINIILMYLSAASTAQNIKKLQQIQSYEEASFTSPKWPTFLKQKFFRKTITKILMQLLVSLIEHCKKIFRADPEFWGCKKFTWNSWQLAHLCKIYKKLLEQIQSYEDVSFLDPEIKLAYLTQRRMFWDIQFLWFLSTYWALHSEKFENHPSSRF